MKKGRSQGLAVVILIIIAVSGFAGHTIRTKRMTYADIYNAALQLREATDPEKLWNLPYIESRWGGSAGDSEEETERRTEADVPAVENTSEEDRLTESAEPVEDYSSDQEFSQNTIVPSVTYVTCPSCGGAGRFTCGVCGGTGQQYIPNLYYDAIMGWTGGYQGCGGCGGSGGTVCSTCGGTGQVIG